VSDINSAAAENEDTPMKSLKAKLTSSMAVVVLLTVVIASLLANVLIENRFAEYIAKQQEKRTQEIAYSLSQLYDKDTDEWNIDSVYSIGMFSLYDGYIIKVRDLNGRVVWDAQAHDMTLCSQVMDAISRRMNIKYPEIEGSFSSTVYQLVQEGETVGSVSIAYFGPVFFNENDSLFLDSLNVVLAAIGIAALIISGFVGVLMSRRLSRPILDTVEATKVISGGRYDVRVEAPNNIRELNLLTRSINQMAESLEKQETLRKQLTADVAHELRTPLTSLQTHIEAMIEGVWQPTPERLQTCYDEASRLVKLVEDLESLARTENGLLQLKKTKVSLADVIRHVLTSYETDLKSKNLSVSLAGNDVTVLADRDRVSQILVNLLSNAIKYSREGGSIRINIARTDKEAKITVEDDGPGIPEDELPHIFERFYRADKSRNRLTGGSGLGLAIVRSIAEAHGGSVFAESHEGSGTIITVLLPICNDE